MQGRIKKVITTYYTLNGDVSHVEEKYYPQIKTRLLPFWRSVGLNIAWCDIKSAKEYLFENHGKKYQEIEYINI